VFLVIAYTANLLLISRNITTKMRNKRKETNRGNKMKLRKNAKREIKNGGRKIK